MQYRTVVVFMAGLAATASAAPEIPANPLVKHLAIRALDVDGSFAGFVYKRQSSCPSGYNSCGSGCSQGPCCDMAAGTACRAGEVCTQINGETGCCPQGYTCGSIRGCQAGLGGYCTPGSVDANGAMCCDSTAPICSTSSGVPYCAAPASSTVYTINPTGAGGSGGGSFDSTVTNSVTATTTDVVVVGTTSNGAPAGGETNTAPAGGETNTAPAGGETTSAPAGGATGVYPPTTTTATTCITLSTALCPGGPAPATVCGPVGFPIPTVVPCPASPTGPGGSGPTTVAATETSLSLTATLTSTAVVVVPVPYPSGNGTTNGTSTTTAGPPQQTGAAGKFGVSGFALTLALGLALFL
ncbi:hypothetical protein TWF694_009838 [Orbilia ellipsospora]|uniref:GPI anchored protein n=1 Tax=Orbilia ellipsospora TaxID=2528407 RepID=A0AAV9XF71_9PEZI